jgi:hypothetical protein
MPAQTIRIGLQQNAFVDGLIDIAAPLVDGDGATPPTFARGTEINLELGFLNSAGTAVLSFTGLESITLAILEPGAGGRSYYQKTVAIASIATSITLAQWNAGTHEHGTWALTSAETNIPTSSEARPLVITCWALTVPDGGGNRQRHFIGGGYLQLLDPGVGGDISPPSPLPYPAVTIGELEAVATALLSGLAGVTYITGAAPTVKTDARGTAGSTVMIADDGFVYAKTASGWTKLPASLLP